MAAGFDCHILKPVDAAQLFALLDEWEADRVAG